MDKMKLSIKWYLMIICVALVAIPVIILGTLSYNNTQAEIYQQIEDRLTEQSKQIGITAAGIHTEITNYEESIETQIRGIVSAQAGAVYEFMNDYQGSEQALLNTMAKIDSKKTLFFIMG